MSDLFTQHPDLVGRIGTISVSHEFLQPGNRERELMGILFTQFIPIQANHDWQKREMQVVGWSPQFDLLAEGEPTPDYRVEIERYAASQNHYEHKITFTRLPPHMEPPADDQAQAQGFFAITLPNGGPAQA